MVALVQPICCLSWQPIHLCHALSVTLLTEKSSSKVVSAFVSKGRPWVGWRSGENSVFSLQVSGTIKGMQNSQVCESSLKSSTFLTPMFFHGALDTFHARKPGFIKTIFFLTYSCYSSHFVLFPVFCYGLHMECSHRLLGLTPGSQLVFWVLWDFGEQRI